MARHKPTPVGQRLKAMLEDAVAKYGTQAIAAEQIGVNQSRFSRVMKSGGNESFEIETCLRLARAIAARPSDVLKAAGKADVVALIEELYGPEREPAPQPEVHVEIHNIPFGGIPLNLRGPNVRIFMNGKEVGRE